MKALTLGSKPAERVALLNAPYGNRYEEDTREEDGSKTGCEEDNSSEEDGRKEGCTCDQVGKHEGCDEPEPHKGCGHPQDPWQEGSAEEAGRKEAEQCAGVLARV